MRANCLYHALQSNLAHSMGPKFSALRYQICSWKRLSWNHSKAGKAFMSIVALGEQTWSASGMPGTGQE